jgi:hypothetical protein
MRALTLTQPWATEIALGHKRIETRSWRTNYRGPVLIHAARGFPLAARRFAEAERGVGRLPERLPLSAIVARARIRDVMPTGEARYIASALEVHLGDYSPGRFAWILEDVAPLEPVFCRGALGLWTPAPEVIAALVKANPLDHELLRLSLAYAENIRERSGPRRTEPRLRPAGG